MDCFSSVVLRRRQQQHSKRTYQINQIFLIREEYDEFCQLMGDWKHNPEKFFNYFYMSFDTFKYIMEKVGSELTKHNNIR